MEKRRRRDAATSTHVQRGSVIRFLARPWARALVVMARGGHRGGHRGGALVERVKGTGGGGWEDQAKMVGSSLYTTPLMVLTRDTKCRRWSCQLPHVVVVPARTSRFGSVVFVMMRRGSLEHCWWRRAL